MSAEHAGAHAPTAGEYIQHHLQHLQMNFSFEGVKQTSIVDFSLFNLDSVVFALVLGVVGCLVMCGCSSSRDLGRPWSFPGRC
jgi:F-type H+-transporting ATPase subunit a